MRSWVMRAAYASLLVPAMLFAEPPADDALASEEPEVSADAQRPRSIQSLVLGEDKDEDGVRDDVEASLANEAETQGTAPLPATREELDLEFSEHPSFTLRAEGWDQMSCQDLLAMNDEDFQAAERARLSRSTFDRRHPCESVKYPYLEHPKVIDTEPGITYQSR